MSVIDMRSLLLIHEVSSESHEPHPGFNRSHHLGASSERSVPRLWSERKVAWKSRGQKGLRLLAYKALFGGYLRRQSLKMQDGVRRYMQSKEGTRRLDEAEVAYQAWRSPHVMELSWNLGNRITKSLPNVAIINFPNEIVLEWEWENVSGTRTSQLCTSRCIEWQGSQHTMRQTSLWFEHLPSCEWQISTQQGARCNPHWLRRTAISRVPLALGVTGRRWVLVPYLKIR